MRTMLLNMGRLRMSDELLKLERKIGELEDELYRKRDAMRDFVFAEVTEKYGVSKLANEKKRKAVLDVFSSLYAQWDKL